MESVLTERRGSVLVITLNRPSKRNAMDGEMAHRLANAVDELDASPRLSVGVLAGAGDTFCAGMDLAAFLTGDVPEVEGRGLGGITRTPPVKPLIAAVEGYALAGGCELALACDLIVAAEDATFGLPEVKRGLFAGSGGLLRLPHRLPPNIAMEYALTGDSLPAREAARWGLVNRVTDTGNALDAAIDLATRIARNGPLGIAATKKVMSSSPRWNDELWSRQQSLLDEVFRSEDAREGASAFSERREPIWKGR